jgi:hypothetical protein
MAVGIGCLLGLAIVMIAYALIAINPDKLLPPGEIEWAARARLYNDR